MCTMETNSMASLTASLSKSFQQVPPAAIPAILDCILASTGFTPSSLFTSLLETFPNLVKDVEQKELKLSSDHLSYIGALVGALCHLLKKSGANHDGMISFAWRIFIPLINMVHAFDREMVNQLAESYFDVVTETNTWAVVEATLVPYFLRSVGLSMGMLKNEELDVFEWDSSSIFQGSNGGVNDLEMDKEHIFSLSGCLPLPISCHILTLILGAARQSYQAAPTSESMLANGCCYSKSFFGNLLWDLCNMSERLVSQSPEHRSCAIGFLLPVIFKAFLFHHSFEISINGHAPVLSRKHFFMRIWKCCRKLFGLGSLERRDAYSILFLYFSFMEGCEGVAMIDGAEGFNLRAEKEFWDEIKRGLVDRESLVRKQSLHILKTALCISEGSQSYSGVSEEESHKINLIPHGMTKREVWADKEARSMGVGKICNSVDPHSDSQQQWDAFFLLYEMLEEYGTHLVEAAWNHQVNLLLQFSVSNENFASSVSKGVNQNHMETLSEIFDWLSILWVRGFCHDNPQVRCLIMQSFLGIEWNNYGKCAKSVPESFVLGPFLQGLNDSVHHKEFGLKGIYCSRTIEGASRFVHQYACYQNARKQIALLSNLATAAKRMSFARAGLMGLAECIASAARAVGTHNNTEAEQSEDSEDAFPDILVDSAPECVPHNDRTNLVESLRFVIESSKRHFNPTYRLRVCEKVLEAAAAVVSTFDVPLEILLHFISTLPREFTDYGGSLRVKVQEWFSGCLKKYCGENIHDTEMLHLKSLHDFPERFTSHYLVDATYDDEDLDAWEVEAKRWARVLFLVIKEEHHLVPILTFIENHGVNVCKNNNHSKWVPVKFLILTLSLVLELQIMKERFAECGIEVGTKSEFGLFVTVNQSSFAEVSMVYQKFAHLFLSILEEVVSFANFSSSVFWSSATKDTTLPGSVIGKLGGPSQRRLSSSTTTIVLQAIISMKAVASISSWSAQFTSDVLKYSYTFQWKFFLRTILSPTGDSETGAEICLATYEALAPVLRAVVSAFSPLALDLIKEDDKSSLPEIEGKPVLDSLVLSFLQNINNLLAVGVLARTRRAVLMKWKWLCLESLLSIPYYAAKNGLHLQEIFFFSGTALRFVFNDLVESLENAGEGSVLPMLRSVRLALELFASGVSGSIVCSCNGVDAQMMWQLVRSSWVLHVSCNKRRVAPIAALLSSVLHSSVFSDEGMHEIGNAPGPLKWFVEKVLEEGTKSPRTIRLAALHLTGMWLSNPRIIKYYMKELKLLSLHGSVAFDEDFEGELSDNHDAKIEVSLLAKSPDPELSEAFINTELYARVSVAVLFYKLADLANMVGSANENEDCQAALESGKLFLLELLDSVVNDKDLAKELYKKYSGIHRRKIRAWQMICVLSQFVDQEIVEQVTHSLHKSLDRNNLPAVRQYLETFAIHIYLKFPSLVREQLVCILRDYDMRPQALSSYVFIAANVILHASEAVQSRHLDELLPPIVPLLTSHHHSLRGFTQLLVYKVLSKNFPLDSRSCEIVPLEKRCFEDLKFYLEKNFDCIRLRASMEGYLDAYNPNISATPAGIFINRVEELEFECVPTSLMEQVLTFLNDVRDDLRCSMAKDAVTIKNESLRIDDNPNYMEITSDANQGKLLTELPKESSLNFQRKVTLSKHEKQDTDSHSFLGNKETYEQLLGIEKEDLLLDQLLRSRSVAMEKIRASRQNFILVASLLDRIPNLAGLARTCEVFKAAGITIADANILHDKQFQLISVTAEKWVPIIEVPVNSVKVFLEKKKREGYSILGLEQTANSIPLDQFIFPKKTVLVLGREKEGIPVDIIHILDACVEIPQLGVVRSLNVHVSGAIALWEYTRQQRS